MQNQIQQLKLRLESYEKTQGEMEESARYDSCQICVEGGRSTLP